jgi:uncharacterized membrane protein YhiD involved in acid resistance
MKFWKRLRWITSVLFVALLLASWLGTERSSSPSPAGSATRAVPTFLP